MKNNKVKKADINKEFIMKWFYRLHNNVNKILKKKIISYKKAKELMLKKNYTNHKNIYILFFIINQYFLKQKLSFYHFEQIKSFYKILGCIYPDNNIKKYYKKHTTTKDFKNISNECELNDWFNDNIDY